MNTIKKLSMTTVGVALITLGISRTAQAGILGGQLFSTYGDVEVQILSSTAGYTSSLSLYSPQNIYIGTNWEAGKVVNLGTMPAGSELLFGIYVWDSGNTFLMGPGWRNPDSAPHAIVDYIAPGVANVRFEDLAAWEDSDWNYNDNVFQFRGGISTHPLTPPKITSLTSDITILTHTLFDFSVSATDIDWRDTLTYQWDLNGDGNYDDFIGIGGQWSFSDPGIHTVGVQVSDRAGYHAYGSFKVKAVPEPSSTLGLLAFGTFGGLLVKRKQQQKVLNFVVRD